MQRVVIGLSGGVDSSVAAYLLKEQGYDVTAVFMINWHDKTGTLEGDCPWKDDLVIAQLVAKKIGIPFQSVDLSKEYKKRVVDYMFAEYASGRTPNPDVLCNREIKFDEFLKLAGGFHADFIATGHYCRKESITVNGEIIHRLLAGTDQAKEQSYFLCQLNQSQLGKALFPVGNLKKNEVREIAARQNLPSANKKDSQGICFIGKVDLPTFLQQKLEPITGDVIEIPRRFHAYLSYNPGDTDYQKLVQPYQYHPDDGIVAGKHRGAHFYTIGQRKGLNIGGKERPLFVIGTDTRNNIIYVGQGEDHPGLYRKGLFIAGRDVHWLRPDLRLQTETEERWKVRIRYRQALQQARIIAEEAGYYIIFDKMQRGITPGQFAAWYERDELIGSGVISS
jgi:tRNA-specific 2-thiouridylase